MPDNVDEILAEFEGLLQTMSQLLEDERIALQQHDIESLSALLENKTAILTQLQKPAFGATLPSAIRATDEPLRGELEARHKTALALARQVRDSNLVNGKVLHRSQKSVGDLLNILSGKPLDGLYGTSGQTVAARQRSGAIAKA